MVSLTSSTIILIQKIDDKKLQIQIVLPEKYDPLNEAYYIYDKILGNYLSLKDCTYVSDRIISNTL